MQVDANRNLDIILEDIEDSDLNNLEVPVILESVNMSEVLIDQIYKALRLLPEFDGNSNVLTRFINLCDQLVAQYLRTDPSFALSNLALLNGILNKVTGPAARTINSNGIPENWIGIRNALINNFADQRDETSLFNDLSLLSQGPATPQEFYEKCQNLFSIIMTYISLHETVHSTIEAKRELYKKLTLQAYLRGLRDPLGSRIRCMRPDTIEHALEYVHEEMNTLYLQQRNDHLPERRMQSTSSFNSHKPSFSFQPPAALPPPRAFTFPPAFNMPGPSKPFTYQPPRPMPVWRPQMPLNRGPTRTQQMFSAPPPNYRPQSNVFRMPQHKTGYQPPTNTGPQPMSGVSHYVTKQLPFTRPMTGHDYMKHGNPPPSNYFKTREMNFNEFYDQPHDYYDPYYSDYCNDYYYTEYCDPTHTYSEQTYVPSYEQQSHQSDYVPAYVEEAQDSVQPENPDFQESPKSERQK